MEKSTHKQALPLGHRLRNYRIEGVLGVGGFGVTYLAAHATLGHRAAIKEYLPNEFAVRDGTTVHPKSTSDRSDFEWGLTRFLDEAKTLARFEHRNLVRVRDYFEANRTAYIVMDYEDGEPLDRLLERHGTLTEAQLKRVLLPIVDGLREVHGAGFLHRDIKPSNVFVRREDESPVLLDFGSARQALGRKSRSLTAVASAGYSPPEQYESDGEQGAWTDIYALSALCYRAIRGESPVEAPRRLNRMAQGQADPLARLGELAPDGFSAALLEAVDQGLELAVARRPANLDEWLVRLTRAGSAPVAGPASSPAAGADRSPKHRSRLAWIAGLVAVVAAAIVGGWLWTGIGGSVSPAVEPPPADPRPTPTVETEPSVLGGAAFLVVRTEPSGAEVLVGDTVVGSTPLERFDILAGTHTVTIRQPYYEEERIERPFADGEVTDIDVALRRGVGKLTVVLEPRDGWIERDGERLAEGTPVTLSDLPAGPLELTLGAAEHTTARVELEVPKDDVARLERTLVRIPYGTLTLELMPPDAKVTLPDVVPAYSPGMRLPEGDHRVAVRRAGYREAMRTVSVSGNTVERIDLSLDPQPFTVETTPAEATVELVGVEEGYRPEMRLPPGEYRLRVTAAEYAQHDETVRHGLEPTLVTVTLEPAIPGPGGTFTDELASGAKGPEMVVIPAGVFRMGCLSYDDACADDERPVHRVRIAEQFALSRHEVAVGEFARFVDETGHRPGDSCRTYEGGEWVAKAGRSWTSPGFRQADDHAAVCVNWDDAVAYVAWLSRETGEEYRLPSESEWEYAARAGTVTRYSWGDEIGRNRANCYDCGSRWDYEGTAPVGSFAPNAWGLHDMHGNVVEWVEDCWNDSYEGAPGDGSAWHRGDCAKRVLRGGSWFRSPRWLRSARRGWGTSGYRASVIGFRVARTLTP